MFVHLLIEHFLLYPKPKDIMTLQKIATFTGLVNWRIVLMEDKIMSKGAPCERQKSFGQEPTIPKLLQVVVKQLERSEFVQNLCSFENRWIGRYVGRFGRREKRRR